MMMIYTMIRYTMMIYTDNDDIYDDIPMIYDDITMIYDIPIIKLSL
jgi:hypothetical protein